MLNNSTDSNLQICGGLVVHERCKVYMIYYEERIFFTCYRASTRDKEPQ